MTLNVIALKLLFKKKKSFSVEKFFGFLYTSVYLGLWGDCTVWQGFMRYLSHFIVPRVSDGALAQNSPSDYAKLIYLKHRNPGYKWGDEPECCVFARVYSFQALYAHSIDWPINSSHLIRLSILPYAARVPTVMRFVCASNRRANSSSCTCHTYSRVHLHYPSLEWITQLTCLLLARFRAKQLHRLVSGVCLLCLSSSSVSPGLHGWVHLSGL